MLKKNEFRFKNKKMKKTVTPSPSQRSMVQGHALLHFPNMEILKFPSFILLQPCIQLCLRQHGILRLSPGRVINFTSEKSLLCRAAGPRHCFRLLRGQACPHGAVMARESVPRIPVLPVPLPDLTPTDSTWEHS
jgi:hypothetical protein